MRRTILFAAVVALLLWAGAAPAMGVWGGTPDGTQHPMVGAMYADFNEDEVITWDELVCSGSYAGPSKDGGHLVFSLIEWLRGKPVSLRKREIAQQVGFVLLVGLMIFAFYNDIFRLLGRP